MFLIKQRVIVLYMNTGTDNTHSEGQPCNIMARAHGADAEAAAACASDDGGRPLDHGSSSAARGRGGEIESEMAAHFAAMDHEVLSMQGCIVADIAAPYFVAQCNGGAAKILRKGASRITSRRIQTICETVADGSKLARACLNVAQDETLRAYLSITTAGRRVPLVVQQTELQPGHLALEVLLFATDECHARLVEDVVYENRFESILTRVPKEFELEVKSTCEDERESLVGLGTASLTATMANDRESNQK